MTYCINTINILVFSYNNKKKKYNKYNIKNNIDN